jgi:uncharacterized protein YkwD
MRHAGVAFVAMLASAVAGPVAAAAASSGAPEQRMINAINRTRAEHGHLRPLRPAPTLGHTAIRFSRWLISHDLFAHSPSSARRGGSGHTGEALAMHFTTRPDVRGTIRSWLRSPAHRALVLTTSMTTAGVGHASGRFGHHPATIWVLEVAKG